MNCITKKIAHKQLFVKKKHKGTVLLPVLPLFFFSTCLRFSISRFDSGETLDEIFRIKSAFVATYRRRRTVAIRTSKPRNPPITMISILFSDLPLDALSTSEKNMLNISFQELKFQKLFLKAILVHVF